MTDPDWIEKLFVEKSLWQTFQVSRSFPATEFNGRIRGIFSPSIFFICLLTSLNLFDADSALRGVDAASGLIASVAATILGFLVAGLAIFTTLSDKKILIALAQVDQAKTNVSTFKYLYYNLLNVFVVYIFVLVFSAVIQVLSKISNSVSDLEICQIIFPTASIVNSLALAFLAAVFLEMLVTLKTFIWNIYATFVSVLTVSTVIPDSEQR